MTERPFAHITLPPERSTAKPRRRGLTMMVDWGLGLVRTRDLLDCAGDYVDLAKIAVGTSRLYAKAYLAEKFALYRERGVRPFLGGQFGEFVYLTEGPDAMPRFFAAAREAGFEIVEISDNSAPLEAEERRRQTRLAIAEGLAVFGEVGSKLESTTADDLVTQAKDFIAEGAELLLVEGAELVEDGKPNMELVDGLRRGLDLDRVLFELPGPWITGVSLSHVHDLKKFLVREFGPDVNIANIMPDDVLETEALRVGLGVVGPKPRHPANR